MKRDRLRLTEAADGLPADWGGAGLSTLGGSLTLTDFSLHVATCLGVVVVGVLADDLQSCFQHLPRD